MSRGRSKLEWDVIQYIAEKGIVDYCNKAERAGGCSKCPFSRRGAFDCAIDYSGFRSSVGKHLSEKKKELELFVERIPKNIQNDLSLDIYIVAEAIRLLQEREDNLNIKKNIQLIEKL